MYSNTGVEGIFENTLYALMAKHLWSDGDQNRQVILSNLRTYWTHLPNIKKLLRKRSQRRCMDTLTSVAGW